MNRALPCIALVDANSARRKRLEELACTLGTGGSFCAVPLGGTRDHRIVLLVDDLGLESIAAARVAFPLARVVIAGSSPEQDDAITAFRRGADDYVWLGAGNAALTAVLMRNVATDPPPDSADDAGMIGASTAMVQLRAFIRKVAPTSATVLITGETGTGKDVAALAVHRLSRRADKPLVALNCAAIPDALIEGELFGYERGAFSGAHTAYPGKFKLADGGTLLLDEIGELSPAGQAKLLRAIEAREVWRLGARAPTRFDVRIIVATNCDLLAEVRAGRFREDLFYRLAVSQLRLPPLRDRPEDVMPLARHLLWQLGSENRAGPARLTAGAEKMLTRHPWPGNVRELRNALEVGAINADGTVIDIGDLPAGLGACESLAGDQRGALVAALAEAQGNKSLAAQTLKCSRMTLYRRIQRHGLDAAIGHPTA